MSEIEQVLVNRVKNIGEGEWTLLGTPQQVIDELELQSGQRVIDELKELLQDLDDIGRLTNYAKIREHISKKVDQLTEQLLGKKL